MGNVASLLIAWERSEILPRSCKRNCSKDRDIRVAEVYNFLRNTFLFADQVSKTLNASYIPA